MAKEEGKWKKISGELVRFDKPGDTVEGELVAKTPSQVFPNRQNYDIRNSEGDIQRILGTVVMDRLLAAVDSGTQVKIVFKGITPSKAGRPVKDFEIFTK